MLRRSLKKTRFLLDYFRIRTIDIPGNEILDFKSLRTLKSLNCWKANLQSFQIYGRSIDLKEINWHLDPTSGFEFPKKLFFNIRITDFFDKGIDIKCPWEVSRFYFAPLLAIPGDNENRLKRYHTFKMLLNDWVKQNPVYKGVNWLVSMEVAIRAVNVAVASSMFQDLVDEDSEFKAQLKSFLVQHALYIFSYPEIHEDGRTTNHATSNYAGLLFLSLILKGHPESKNWLKVAVDGLELCIRNQTYDDGVNFEASIPYHRLTLEMFSLSALIAVPNNITLSKNYYQALFKMFEYAAAYTNRAGIAPQIGDNDSGRFLWFDNNEHNHSYLLEIGNAIFDYDFKSSVKSLATELQTRSTLISTEDYEIQPKDTTSSILFNDGGGYILKNESFFLFVSCFPIGKDGNGGHNHADTGSFTLSVHGKPLIVDPGTYSYTRDSAMRNHFRSYSVHNVVLSEYFNDSTFDFLETWRVKSHLECRILDSNEKMLKIEIVNRKIGESHIREFILDDEKLVINDFHSGFFKSQLNVNPDVSVKKMRKKLQIDSEYIVASDSEFNVLERFYSQGYDQVCENKNVVHLSGQNKITTVFEILGSLDSQAY